MDYQIKPDTTVTTLRGPVSQDSSCGGVVSARDFSCGKDSIKELELAGIITEIKQPEKRSEKKADKK